MLSNLTNLEKLDPKYATLDTKLTFGKYKGETIRQVTEYDGEYIMYLYDLNLIKPDKALLEQIYKTLDERNHNESNELDFWEEIFG